MEEVEVTKKSAEKVKRVVRAIGMSFKIMKNRLKVFKYFMIFFNSRKSSSPSNWRKQYWVRVWYKEIKGKKI